jgi:hypothetical protein
MQKLFNISLLAVLLVPLTLLGQPEQQISFARESRPHTYYVTQAELWWKEVQKDSKSENNWYNYFRACRNAHGTADWRSEFINESPYLKRGDSIVSLISKNIPNSFTYYYLSYLNGGIGTDNGQNLLNAYQINPNFEGIHSSVIIYVESSLNKELRKKVNKEWFKTNYLSSQLMTYAYNVLMSLDSNAVLFTQQDNDTYPLWMLQDVLNIRPDVSVINIDFLLIESYRKQIYTQLNVSELKMGTIDIDEYHTNWRTVLTHVLANYKNKNTIFLGMTVAGELYKDFEQKLYPCGLAFKYCEKTLDLNEVNKTLYEKVFLIDYLQHHFSYDLNQVNVDYQNLNYLTCFETIYKQYKLAKKYTDAKKLKNISLLLAKRIGKQEYVDWVEKEFN